MREPQWLTWAKRLQALSQIGLTYAKDAFDVERYQTIRQIAAEIMAQHAAVSPQQVVDLFAQEMGYATPKVGVRGAVFREREGVSEILLVQELADDRRWTVPGGFADVGDLPSEAAVREVREESGYRVRPIKLAAVYEREKQGHLPPRPYALYKLYFICELVGGTPRSSTETGEIGFFREDALPALSLDKVTPYQIERMFVHYRQPDLPTEFD